MKCLYVAFAIFAALFCFVAAALEPQANEVVWCMGMGALNAWFAIDGLFDLVERQWMKNGQTTANLVDGLRKARRLSDAWLQAKTLLQRDGDAFCKLHGVSIGECYFAKGFPPARECVEHWVAIDEAPPLDSSENRTEAVTGWRVWYAEPIGDYTVLRSAYVSTLWPAGKPMEAHELKQFGFGTGVHAFNSREAALASEYMVNLGALPLFGTVALWGRVIEHEKGYRAQYAYPQKLYVPYGVEDQASLAKSVAKTYGCEVEIEPAPSEAA